MAKYEHELEALDGTGLSDLDTDAALTYLLGFVQSHCRSAHDAARTTTDSAMSDADWWAANQPILAGPSTPNAIGGQCASAPPQARAQGSAWNAGRAWEFGLARPRRPGGADRSGALNRHGSGCDEPTVT